MSDFLAAINFLTRFQVGKSESPVKFSIGLFWHGVVGLGIGLFCAALAVIIFYMLAPGGNFGHANESLCALLAALFWLAGEIWLTRGLHWDGVADLGDALGSCAKGKKFREILKDSRLGSFGAILLFLLLAGQWIAAALHIMRLHEHFSLLSLVLAPAWARLAPVWCARNMHPLCAQSLGAFFCGQITASVWLASFFQAALILLLLFAAGMSLVKILLLAILQFMLVCYMRAQARANGGISGDYLGCMIEFSQLIFLLPTI